MASQQLFVRDPEAPSRYVAVNADELLARAREVALRRLRRGAEITTCSHSRDYLVARMRGLEHDIFACLFLDHRNRLIKYVEMFRGTIDGASVHPREVVKASLKYNAAAVILAHNHPSGVATPSRADELITQRLKDALELVEIRVLDHIIIAGEESMSFVSQGILERPSWELEEERERERQKAERRAGRRRK